MYARMYTGEGQVSVGELLRAPRAPDPTVVPTDPVEQARLVHALCEPGRLCEGTAQLIETHISYVLLTGRHAYKIKKAVALPFLDFRALEARRRFCEEELRLNRRAAPELYLDIVPITGSVTQPEAGGRGAVLDYAVRMREFPQAALLCNVLERGELTSMHIDALAARLAQFHAAAARAAPGSAYGSPHAVLATALANFTAMYPHAATGPERTALRGLQRWTRMAHAACRDALQRRMCTGAIRECHGDLHLGNLALVDGDIALFDCIEFDPALRWIDTMSEVAFTVMDLDHRGQPGYARRFLNAYLEHTGDYAGMPVLRFYLVYRAMVRAKIARLRAAQLPAGPARAACAAEATAHLRRAIDYAQAAQPAVVLMHGPSGCGKSAVSQLLLERAGAVRVRTDVERKRLAGLAAGARSGSTLAGGLYTPQATRHAYEHVLACAGDILRGGFCALVDGTFLKRWQRDAFRELAVTHGVAFVVVDCIAPRATLVARVVARAGAGLDPSEADLAVLTRQLCTAEPLGADEAASVVALDTGAPLAQIPQQAAWRALLDAIGRSERTERVEERV